MAAVTLLDACAAMGVEAYVQTGSSSEYGFKDHPAREDEAIEPNSHYAITKAAATHYAQFTSRQRGLHAVTLRLYSVYGPYEEPSRLIPTLLVSGFERRLPPLVSPAVAETPGSRCSSLKVFLAASSGVFKISFSPVLR